MPNRPSGLHHPTAIYAKQVVSGRLHDLCGPAEIAACQRHLNDLARQGTEDFPYVFDTTRADRVYRWFGVCHHVRGVFQGQPIMLQPWQQFDLGCIYGWVHRDTGARRFNRVLSKRGRGNVKSTENSCKALYHMCADALYPPYRPDLAAFEHEPEVECVAVDKEQARRVFGDAKKIALKSPSISKRLVIPKSNPVAHRTRGGWMRALSGDTKNKDSGAPSYYCVDEYEAHRTSELYDIGLNSFGKRVQPLLDCIMTAGDDAESRPARREEEYARRVVTGEISDESYFVMLRELPMDANPHDERLWAWANPVLRYPDEYSKYLLAQIKTEHDAAYNSGDSEKIRKWLTRRMCQWQAASVNSYLDERQLKLAAKAMIPSDEFARLTDGLAVWCGFDLGKRIDLSGVGAVIPLPDGRIGIRAQGFMPQNRAEAHEHSDRVPYIAWAKDGYCVLTPGDVTDNSYVYTWIRDNEDKHHWELREVDYDGHNATDLAIEMRNDRNNEDFCVEIRQTCAGQTLAVKTFREMLMQGKIVMEYSPLLLWCLRNAIVHENYYGDIKLSKAHKDDTQRIDPLAAVMNALSRALLREDKPDLSRAAASAAYEM